MFPKLKSSFGTAGKTVSIETKTVILLRTTPIRLSASYNFITLVELKELVRCDKP